MRPYSNHLESYNSYHFTRTAPNLKLPEGLKKQKKKTIRPGMAQLFPDLPFASSRAVLYCSAAAVQRKPSCQLDSTRAVELLHC